MESIEQFLIVIVRIVFIVFIPVVTLYFRVIRKIQTGFAVGIIITSFIFGLLISGSITEDPVKVFTRTINKGDSEESRIALKRVIQAGETTYGRIDEGKISDPALYRKLRAEILKEYTEITERYYANNSLFPAEKCENIPDYEVAVKNLSHADLIWSFSKLLGGGDPALREKIQGALESGGAKLENLRSRCPDHN